MNPIKSFRIKGYRTFRDFHVEGLGKVNLITGKNNTGKSSFLEAMHLFCTECSDAVLYQISQRREEVVNAPMEKTGDTNVSDIEAIFHGFPYLAGSPLELELAALGRVLKVKTGWMVEEVVEDGVRRRFSEESPDSSDETEGSNRENLALLVDGPSGVQLRSLRQMGRQRRPYSSVSGRVSREHTCFYVGAYGGENTTDLGELFDNVVLTDLIDHVLDALRLIDSDIGRVAMTGLERRPGRVARVRKTSVDRPIALRSLGDGVNRLFGIILNMVNAAGGVLLIDEFENGLHYSVQYDAWRIIFKLAADLDIQVFATSHSWDAVEAFQKVANESPEKGSLVRLTRKGEDIRATVLAEAELATATRNRIEVR